ncbi:MAG: galactose mutarotase, partial [Bacilli bacterium]|nr:galactose mutarotase [Bacilli bacterium]
MKTNKIIFALAFASLLASCQTPAADSSIAASSPAEESLSSAEASVSTPTEGTSSAAATSSQANSTPNSLDEGRTMRTDELYTDSGFVVKFKAQGARIDKITYGSGNKQIAKDGFTVGRVANRIANGRFTLNGTTYNVTKNSGNHSLHGGGSSWQGPFATANWTKAEQTASTITYTYHSAANESGYPGNLDATVKYTLKNNGELTIDYTAVSDADTLYSPTNHLFMSLNGNSRDANHKLWIDADNYTPLSNQIPTGAISPVSGTKFDYTTEKNFSNNESYDDNYVLNGTGYRKVSTLTGTDLGVQVDVYTDRAGLQLYRDGSGNICLETQMFPDMINHPEWDEYGTTILRANEEFHSKTTY